MATSTQVKDQIYFMETVVFQVENYLFKIPRYQFETNSEIFSSTSLLPTGDDEPEGSSEAAPFKLEGVSVGDFRNFLAALYPLSYPPKLSMNQWVSVLKLSTMWMFLDLRRTAIRKLLSFSMTPQTVLLGNAYSSVELFTAGCFALVNRPTSLSEDEAMMLGYETAFRLCILREKKDSLVEELPLTFDKQLSAIAKKEAKYGTPKAQPEQPMYPPQKKRRC